MAMWFSGCGQGNVQNEKRAFFRKQTDSLWVLVKSTRSNFRYDMDEIATRRDGMERELTALKFATEKELSPDEKTEIIQYNSVYRVYKSVAGKYKNVVLETEDLFYRVKALDKSTREGQYDNRVEEFKNTSAELKAELLKIHTESEELSEQLSSIEPLFIRLQPKIQELADRFIEPVN